MAFTDGCSCHVWAIDGWTDDALSAVVNASYAEAGTSIMLDNVGGVPTLYHKVSYLLAHCRETASVPQQGFLYGGFQKVADGAPEHMWFEHGGYIYDTMPGSPLRRIAANPLTRTQPPSESQPFPQNRIAIVPFSLTSTQYQLIAGGGIAWQQAMVADRMVDFYTPPG